MNALLALVVLATTTGVWPMYQLKPDKNAVIPRSGFAVTWNRDIKAKINSGLALAGDSLIFDTFDGRVVVLDVKDGSTRWQAHTDNVVMSTPVVYDGMVFIGTGRNGPLPPENRLWGRAKAGDHVIAYDLLTGRKIWQYRTIGEDMPSPAIADGVLVFANGDAHAYGLQPKTGKLLWRTALSGISTMASATVAGPLALVSVCAGSDYAGSTIALVPKTGRVAWSSPYGNCDSSPAYAQGSVFVSGADSNVVSFGPGGKAVVAALDPRTGHPRWVYHSQNEGIFTSVGSAERVVAGTYASGVYYQAIPSEDALVAFDAKTGKIRWRMKSMGPIKMSPVIVNGHLYVGDTVGVFYIVDAMTGRLLQERPDREAFSTTPPLVVGNTLIIVEGTKIHALAF